MIDLFSPEARRNPYPAYEQLRRLAPVIHDPGTGFWMAFSYDAVKRVLQDHDTFSSRHGPAEWMIFLDPPAALETPRLGRTSLHAAVGGQPGAADPRAYRASCWTGRLGAGQWIWPPSSRSHCR